MKSNALNLMQTSLDRLRAARPDYTPRIGHVWPIVDPPANPLSRKNQAGTRQGSVVPGTPANVEAGSSPTKQGQENQLNKPPQESEDTQVWEPFAQAFFATRYDMENRKRLRGITGLGGAAGVSSRVEFSSTGDVDTSGRTSSGIKVPGLLVPPAVPSETRTSSTLISPSVSTTRLTVPPADAPPVKQKNIPGPPGRVGEGKKKKKRKLFSSLQ